jgi:DNA modification methylase
MKTTQQPATEANTQTAAIAVGSGALLDGKILNTDCLNALSEMPDESVALIVTSPPYFNAREYAKWKTYAEYLAWCEAWITECLRVLKDGRMICINTSSVIEARASRGERSRRYNIPGDIWGICQGLGAWFAEEIIWEKPEGAAINRNQRFHLDRHPMQWRANATTERVLVCQKPTDDLNDEIIREQNTAHRIEGEYDRGEVWRINPEQQSEHPAAYPLELPAKLIRYYSWPGETVLDPFCGSGTTCRAAKDQNRRYIGIERNQTYAQIANKRIAQGVLLAV